MTFSVVIPTYNRAAYLADTLRSIEAQTFRPREIIVVDDGSSDGTRELVGRLFPSVAYRLIENSGPGVARSTGMMMASSDWIAFCDSDDLWKRDHLATIAETVAVFPQARFVFTNFCNFRGNPENTYYDHFAAAPQGWWERQTRERRGAFRLLVERSLPGILEFCAPWPSASAVQRDAARAAGETPQAISRLPSEDLDLTCRFAAIGTVACAERMTAKLRRHAANYSADMVDNIVGRVCVMILGLTHHASIFADYRQDFLREIDRDLAKTLRRSLWEWRCHEAGHLHAVLAAAGLRPGRAKERMLGRCFALANPVTRPFLRPRFRWLLAQLRANLALLETRA